MKLLDKIPKKLTVKKWLMISVGLVFTGAIFAFTKPVILQGIIRWMYVAKPGHYIRWKHESKQKMTYKLYIWNITNPVEFEAGKQKPKFKEVGPYVFNQYKRKVNSQDNELDDTVSFNYWNIYFFNPSKSLPLTGDEMIFTFNTVITAGMAKIVLEAPHLTQTAIESINDIFKSPNTMLLHMKAIDFIDKGIEIDCHQTSIAAKVACKALQKHKGLRMVNNDNELLRYRWFDHINDTVQGRYTVLRGSRNIQDVGRVIAINGEALLSVYKQNYKCNLINGTDKMFFPPFQEKSDVLWIHAESACKSFPLRFKKMKRKRGITTAYKFVDLADPLLNPACECNKFSGCVDKGTMDLSACVDFYVSLSQPHFSTADEKLRQQVDGMYPDPKFHESGIYFDLLSSGPILAYERFQINFLVKKIPEYPLFSKLPGDLWMPLLWYEESFSMPLMDLGLVVGSTISKLTGVVTGYILLLMGLIGCNILLVTHLQQHLKVLPAVTLVKSADDPEQSQGATRFKKAVNDVMNKFVRGKNSQKS
uniref:Sensory neuron membrane protein 1 n=1 Tax=Bradysia odoriphaga TaxID=1564500 RepID=A0A6B9CAE8_9DIPT|nr:sensory neuron membrane protein 1e [Bradysia odoriphaga]